MAAISDKTAGFQHAIKVYHTMLQMRIPPDIYIFNLLMEAVRLCGVQDANAVVESGRKAQIMIQKQGEMETLQTMKRMEMRKMREMKKKKKKEAKKQESSETENGDSMKAETVNSSVNLPVKLTTTESGLDILPENKPEQIEGITKNRLSLVEKGPSQVQETHVPNLLKVNTLDQVVSIGPIATASDRLALIGGTAGILEILAMHQIQPDVRFFTQLLDSVEQNKDAEVEVLAQMDKTGVVGDVGFYSRLIRRRNMRQDYEDAKEVLVLMSEKGIFPNMNTFGCLAMGCTNRHLANQLLETMDSAAFYPNSVIFAIFAKQSGDNFLYKLDLLKKMESLDIQPNDKFIMYIEDSIAKAKRIIKIKELPPGKQAKFKPVPKFCDDQWYEYYKTFIQEWTPWLKRTMYQKPEHPWSRFGHEKQVQILAEKHEKRKKKREEYLSELERMKEEV
ncbi:pentatricopeptide repeat-containing protein 1, mitochondrial-like [Lingula anatina]|uniref:Pentatricopeptide repeat-containing protein 1, mitochondrial-like n=1 Tax=Lingula anatina TaxID=7574 RepID=A0A1S3HY54_LINAN|nr:pentatricopeptide repeat-containing protein 1, mitochondrial-like [Lingula anatina]|eukprot:XP_013390496.1 pentatricopeptide repeat-containing protein 1, mitochondrial-like [Lingula anatina]